MQIPKSCKSDAKIILHDVVTLVSSANIFTPAIVHYVIHHHLTFRVRDQFTWKEEYYHLKFGRTLGKVGPPSNRPLHPTPCQLAGNKLVHKRVGGVVKTLQGGGAWAYSPSEPLLHCTNLSGVVIFELKQSTATIVPTESNIFYN